MIRTSVGTGTNTVSWDAISFRCSTEQLVQIQPHHDGDSWQFCQSYRTVDVTSRVCAQSKKSRHTASLVAETRPHSTITIVSAAL